MEKIKHFLLTLIFTAQFFCCSSASAVNNVFVLKACAINHLRADQELGIIADSSDWVCNANATNQITGTKKPPITSFIFSNRCQA